MSRPPLNPFAEVADEKRHWNPEWYSWLVDFVTAVTGLETLTTSHTATLTSHTTTLANHTATLASHTTTLAAHTAALAALSPAAVTVADLPDADSVSAGTRQFVTDATSTVFHAVAVGGGSNKMVVVSDGTLWHIGG